MAKDEDWIRFPEEKKLLRSSLTWEFHWISHKKTSHTTYKSFSSKSSARSSFTNCCSGSNGSNGSCGISYQVCEGNAFTYTPIDIPTHAEIQIKVTATAKSMKDSVNGLNKPIEAHRLKNSKVVCKSLTFTFFLNTFIDEENN